MKATKENWIEEKTKSRNRWRDGRGMTNQKPMNYWKQSLQQGSRKRQSPKIAMVIFSQKNRWTEYWHIQLPSGNKPKHSPRRPTTLQPSIGRGPLPECSLRGGESPMVYNIPEEYLRRGSDSKTQLENSGKANCSLKNGLNYLWYICRRRATTSNARIMLQQLSEQLYWK